MSRELLARVWQAGAGPGDAPFTIDLDSTICETYGLAKEGARHHGYTGARGYHPLLAAAAATGDVLMARLREGRANTARGAAHFLRENGGAGALLRSQGPTHGAGRQRLLFPRRGRRLPPDQCPLLRRHPPARPPAESHRGRYPKMPGRRFLTGLTPPPGSRLALFATYSYHGFITDRDGETLELETDHRRHAEIENAIRDLKYGVGLNHLPSGRFGLGQQIVTTKTLRRRVFALAGTDHPLGTPIDPPSSPALALGGAVQPRLGPTASHSTPSLTAPVPPLTRQPTQRPRKLAPAQSASASCRVLSRHLALHSHCRPPSVPPKAPADRPPTSRLPKLEPGSSRL